MLDRKYGILDIGVQQRDPCTGLDRPLRFQEIGIPRFSGHLASVVDRVVSRTHWPPLRPAGGTPDAHFCYRLNQALGPSAARKITSIKNTNDTGIRDLPACSAVPQPIAPPRTTKSVISYMFHRSNQTQNP